MAYTKTNWVNDSSPYIDAANLNKIEQGIEDAHNQSGGTLESFDVPISSGWQANLNEVPNAVQSFRKKSGVVVLNGLYLVQTPVTAGTVIATLPIALRPSYRVKGTAFAQLAGQNTFSPVPFYIETNGQFGILFAPPTEFSLILETTYFV